MSRGSIGGKTLGILLGVVAAIVVVLVAVVLLLQTGAVSRRIKDLVLPRATAAVGRDVTVKDARLRLFPSPRVELIGATVAGRPGEPPLVELQSLDVQIALWPLVRSFGKDVRIDGIRLVRPVVNLVRAQDGTWNYQGLGQGEKAAAGGPVAPGPRAGPPPASSGGSPEHLVVAHASIEDGAIRYLDRAGGRGEAAVAVSKIQLSADHVGVGEPLEAKLSAALAGPEQNFTAQIHVDRLPASLAALGPGRYPQLTGSLALVGFDLNRVRAFLPPSVTGAMTGGRVDVDAKLSTKGDQYQLDGGGKLTQVRLRGEPAQGGFELHAVADAATGAVHARFENLSLEGPGVDLGGSASLDASPVRIRFAIAGPLLDLGHLLAALPQQEQAKQATTGLSLTTEQRRQVSALDVSGTLDIARVVKGKLTATAFKARAALESGVFVLHDASADFFGGRVDASGTRLDLARAVPAWTLAARLEGIDVAEALKAMEGSAPVLGKLSGSVDLDGAGADWPALRKTLTGKGALALKEGALTTTDLGGQVLGGVASGLRAVGKQGAAGAVSGAGGKTPLRDLAVQFTVKDGAMTLSRPLTFATSFGTVELGGWIGLDSRLGLRGWAKVSKQALAQVVGGAKIPLPSTLDVPLAVGGTLEQPSVSVDAGQAVAGLLSGAARQGLEDLKKGAVDDARRAAQRGLGDLLHQFGK